MSKLFDVIQQFDAKVNTPQDAAEWIARLLEGNLQEAQSFSQLVSNAEIGLTLTHSDMGVISVGLLDLQDFVLCCYAVQEDHVASKCALLRLSLLLSGQHAALGSILKAVLKIVYLQHGRYCPANPTESISQQFDDALRLALPHIQRMLHHETARHYWKGLDWQQPERMLAHALNTQRTPMTAVTALVEQAQTNLYALTLLFKAVRTHLHPERALKLQQQLALFETLLFGLSAMIVDSHQELSTCLQHLAFVLGHDDPIQAVQRNDRTVPATPLTRFKGWLMAGFKLKVQPKQQPFTQRATMSARLSRDPTVNVSRPDERFREDLFSDRVIVHLPTQKTLDKLHATAPTSMVLAEPAYQRWMCLAEDVSALFARETNEGGAA